MDSEVLEQKRLTLRQDIGHISTENRGSGCPVIGSADDCVREGAENSVCLTLAAAAVRAERSRRQLIRKTQDKESAVCLLGLFHV